EKDKMSEWKFDWKRFQKHNKYTDEEMKTFMNDPVRAKAAPMLFSPAILKKNLIIEVVESHGCSAGLKPGDKLVFRALGILDPSKSSPWCAQAMGEFGGIANILQDRYAAGLDPNDSIWKYFSCMDCGPKYGWGQVIMKAYVEDEK
ncbi:MAG TPA: hypothetical protein PLB69_04675, partial [Smithellaceae bacterium]|nr:hypothetical protein [Smithellaceae bacterium]HQO14508.1 hypothetical protein [Smithellaceae bacterium]